MKKTLRFLSMAALVLMGATMTGCISNELVNEQNARGTVFNRPAQTGKQQNGQQATDAEVDAVVKTMHL